MAEQLNNVVLWDSTNAKMRTIDTSNDTLRWNVNTTIGGNLTVTGTTTTVHSETVLIQDNFLDLNYGNTTSGSGEAGGLTVNYQATATSTTASVFAAGPPTITVADSSGFAANDIIQVYGSSDQAANDGIFIIQSVPSSTSIVCQGVSGTAVAEPFARNNFTAASGQSANIRKVNLSVLRANASGVWQIGTGATSPLTYEAVQKGSDSAESLQGAYNAGATIETDSSTDIAFTLTSGNFTASGAGSVNLEPTGASSFTSGGALTLTGAGASTWSTSSGALTIDSAGVLTMDTVGTDAINLGTGSAAKAITIGADASTLVDINALDIQLDAGSGGYDIDGAGNSTITTSGTGTLTIDSAGALVIDTDGTDSISIGTQNAAKIITIGHDASTKVDLNALAIELDSAGTIVANSAGAMTLDAAAASNFTVAGANLDLKTTTSGDVNVSAAANLDLDGATVDIDSAAALSLDAGAASNFTTSAGALTLNGAAGVSIQGNAAQIDLTTSGAMDLNSGALTITPSTMAIDPSSTFDLDAAGAITVDGASFTVGGDSDTGAIAMTATSAAMTLTAGAASTWSTSAGALTLDGAAGVSIAGNASEIDLTTTSTLDLNSGVGTWNASRLTVATTDTTNLTMTANSGGDKTMTIKSENSGGGDGKMVVESDGRLDVVGTGGLGMLSGYAAGAGTVNDGMAVLVCSKSESSGGAGIYSGLFLAANSAGSTETMLFQAKNTGSGGSGVAKFEAIGPNGSENGKVWLTTSANDDGSLGLSGSVVVDTKLVDINAAGAFQMNSADDSNLTVTGSGKDLVLAAAGGGAQKLQLDSAGTGADAIDISASAGGLKLSATSGTVDIDATTFDVDTTGIWDLRGTGGSGILVNETSASDIFMSVSSLNSGSGNSYITVSTETMSMAPDSGGADQAFLRVSGTTGINAATGIVGTAGESVSAGDLVYTHSSGAMMKADASAIGTAFVTGAAMSTVSASATTNIASLDGSLCIMAFASAPSASDYGKRVYLSETAGKATLTPPTTGGSVVYQIGILSLVSGSNYHVQLHRQFIIENP
jgi:hypothetical protein